MITCYQLFEEHEDSSPPFWKDIVLNFTLLSNADLRGLGVPSKYVNGYSFGSFVADQKYYLPYLTSQLQSQGVVFEQAKIENLTNDPRLQEMDVIFNCTGLGAGKLLQDETVYPIRGQVLRVR